MLFTDVIEAALAALDVERVHVVGHSMGGALTLAARQPERTATMTVLAPAGLGLKINGGFIVFVVIASQGCGGGWDSWSTTLH